jgi:isopentenyldiphosphate isomerase
MKNTIETRNTGESKVRAIGIFIINEKGEMLLQKKMNEKLQQQWDTPCFVHDDSVSSPRDAAQVYLKQLGIDCELYEAFGISPSYASGSASKGEHIIIGLTKSSFVDVDTQAGTYKWAHIKRVLQDANEQSQHYAPWLRQSLEGVALYLKSYLNNQESDQSQTHVEL